MLEILLILVGFVILIKSADWLVEGASSLAKRFGISDLVIGLTIVAFGTSAPELAVNVFASLKRSSELAISNVLGSNIANILLILGVCALISNLKVHKNTVWKEIPLSLLAVIMVFVLGNDAIMEGASSSAITRGDGIALLGFFIIFMYYTFGVARVEGNGFEVEKISALKSIVFVAVGCLGLAFGGKIIVDSALGLASLLGLSQALVGITVLAFGTSLPELAASGMAAWRGNTDMAIGNVVGSNIFNVLLVLSTSAIINPIPLVDNVTLGMAILASILLFSILFVGRRHTLTRWEGCTFLVLYAIYISYALLHI
ncbi:sodium:calcium antiporter [Candidatus Woesearchaeota archaeon]|nr:MAG: sodium:calcium antiporter [Candidatus Woesearchaeota archaeon]